MAGQLVYEVHFWTDFHRGSGLSVPGLVDAALDQGADGLPRLLGSTIKGLARDGARRALAYLGELIPDEHALMRSVFGRPATDAQALERKWAQKIGSSEEGPFVFLPAVLPREGDLQPLRHLMTERRFHNRVDHRLGRVKEDFFFSREVGRHDLIFVGRVTWEHEPVGDEVVLLALGLRMIETVGGKRNRGEGTCLIQLQGVYNGHWDPARDGQTDRGAPRESGEELLKDIGEFVDAFRPSATAAGASGAGRPS